MISFVIARNEVTKQSIEMTAMGHCFIPLGQYNERL